MGDICADTRCRMRAVVWCWYPGVDVTPDAAGCWTGPIVLRGTIGQLSIVSHSTAPTRWSRRVSNVGRWLEWRLKKKAPTIAFTQNLSRHYTIRTGCWNKSCLHRKSVTASFVSKIHKLTRSLQWSNFQVERTSKHVNPRSQVGDGPTHKHSLGLGENWPPPC